MEKNNYSVALICLGCDKNRVDSEVMLAHLKESNFEITSDISQADLIIVNSCGFLEDARKESLQWVFKAKGVKKASAKIMVTGCMAQQEGQELYKYLTEADAITSAQNADIVEKVCQCLNSDNRLYYPPVGSWEQEGERLLSTPRHYAFLRIADGCDNYCSYCLIPSIRGRYRSRAKEDIIFEAEKLLNQGVKELILVAQDTTKYGIDLYKKPALEELLTSLSRISGLWKIRLLYCYPELVGDSLLGLISANDKMAKYIDIPVQHVSESILRAMNRKSGASSVKALFEKLKNEYPQIAVRSTFICGFPGESEQNFEEVKDFLATYRLSSAGFFAYSREKGTRSYSLPNQIPKAVKTRRQKELYNLQSGISLQNNKKLIGNTFEAIVDKFDEESGKFYCRTEFQSPDIDGICIVDFDPCVELGDIVKIKITNCDNYDLTGELIK